MHRHPRLQPTPHPSRVRILGVREIAKRSCAEVTPAGAPYWRYPCWGGILSKKSPRGKAILEVSLLERQPLSARLEAPLLGGHKRPNAKVLSFPLVGSHVFRAGSLGE